MQIKTLVAVTAAASAMLLAASAQAESFSGAYSETYNQADPGLKIGVDAAPPNGVSALDFTLAPGQSTSIDIFKIYTPESSVDADDEVAKAISATFSFAGASDSAVTGSTVGMKDTDTDAFPGFSNNHEYGQVAWDGVDTVTFLDGAKLDVSLKDAIFNESEYYGLADGGPFYGGTAEDHGTEITATFTLEGGAPVSAAPEPFTWALMMIGVGAIGCAFRIAKLKHGFSFARALSA